ncbi:MAG: penicillin acylase family protein [Candidatus Binatia bacterium]
MAAVFSAFLRPLLRHLDKVSHPKYRGNLTVAGLHEKVKVVWQSHGIPHVFANSEHDLFLAQGYLHAQERLWQMDMSRRFLTGRLAEVFGNFSLPWKELSSQFRGRDSADFDYFMRLVGVSRSANASLALLSDADRRRLQAYSEGVNRYIEHCRNKLPWEFRILVYEPEPWCPEDSLIIGKGFAFLLSTALFTRLNMIALAAKLRDQPDHFRSLYPSYPEGAPTITRAVADSLQGISRFINGTVAATEWHPAGRGSNNWVIGPARSASGSAILCNDPHLRMTLPSIWYLMHLRTESTPNRPDGYEVWGASIPGSPCIQLGHNRHIAWGITAALCDDVELYRERIHPLDASRYLVGCEWHTLESRQEIIRIRGKREIEKTVRSTRHGPLISDFHQSNAGAENLAFRWTAHEASREFYALYLLNQARDWNEFLESLSYHAAPSLNYVYADTSGNIGYSLAGKIAIRPEIPSLLPLEGSKESNEWRGYIPFNELPRIYNPPEGIIATANNQVVDTAYPYYLSHFFEPPYRIRRIQEILAEQRTFSVNELAEVQMDNLSLHAKELIGALKSDLHRLGEESPRLKPAADRLMAWDGKCHENSVGSTIYHLLHQRLLANLLQPVLGDELFSAYLEIFNQCLFATDQILKNSASPWFATRSRYDLIDQSLRQACNELEAALGADVEGWQWGKIHALLLNHSLGRIGFLKALLAIGPVPSAGDNVTINMGFYRHSNPFAHTVGASLRFSIDTGHWEKSGFVLSSGQSGHVLSPHYGDQTELWRAGERLCMFCPESEKDAEKLLVLEADSSSKGRSHP